MGISGYITNLAVLGRALPPWTEGSGSTSQALSQYLKLIQHFSEQWKLIPFEDFVDYFIASGWVVNAVVVFFAVTVEVVVLQE